MPQLDPTWFASQLFWLALSFIVLYFVLARLMLPRIQNVLEARETTVSSDLKTAQGLTAQANHAKQDYERTLADARARAQQLFDESLLAQKDRTDAATKSMDVQVANMLANANKRISIKKQELMQALVPATTELAGLVVERLTKEALAHEALQAAVDDVMKARG